jgi:hypothetical protein
VKARRRHWLETPLGIKSTACRLLAEVRQGSRAGLDSPLRRRVSAPITHHARAAFRAPLIVDAETPAFRGRFVASIVGVAEGA